MPKVEAGHRHRGRPAPIPQPRFPTLRAENHTYEFDRQYQSLRVSWSGGQTLLSAGEARQLHGFLRRVYEPADRPAIPYKPRRRERRVSHPQTKPHEQPPQEASQETALEFHEYNGWQAGYPTWSVFTILTGDTDTYEAFHRIADQQPGGIGGVRRAVLGTVEQWKNNKPTPYAEAARMLVQSFLINGAQRVEWTPVYETLRGEQQELGNANVLTRLAYKLLSGTDWQAIVKDAEYLTDADTLLRDWLQDQCITWIESPDARAYKGAVATFANTVLDTYFQAVKWEKVTSALRGE